MSAAPHRPMFLAGAVQLVLPMLLWLLELAGRVGVGVSAPLPFTIASTSAHFVLMLYGVFVFFIYGFLFTVFPRWTGGTEVPRQRYMAVWVLSILAMGLTYIGLLTDRRALVAGLTLHLLAWIVALAALLASYRSAPKRGLHEQLLLFELGLGALGIVLLTVAIAADWAFGLGAARELGLWGFLVPVLLTVCHRMIPFFTQSALPFTSVPRPGWSLAAFVGGSLLHGFFEIIGWSTARLVVDAALAGIALHHSIIWGLRRSFSVRLLAMLHLAFLWFGVAMMLYVVQGALLLAGISALGRAPLHALAIGFIAGTLLAMATRVTLGHSGRALTVKAPTWYLFLAFSVGVTSLRLSADLFPTAGATLNLIAATGWLACLLPWAARYAPIYWRPRADHRPG